MFGLGVWGVGVTSYREKEDQMVTVSAADSATTVLVECGTQVRKSQLVEELIRRGGRRIAVNVVRYDGWNYVFVVR